MRFDIERLESKVLLAADFQVVQDAVQPAEVGKLVTRTIRVFTDEAAKVQIQSQLTDELEAPVWQRKFGSGRSNDVDPFVNVEPDFLIENTSPLGVSAVPVRSAGDINGDGNEDFIVGTLDGRRFALFGGISADRDLSNLSVDEGVEIVPPRDADLAFSGFRSLRDINGDGFDDLAFGDTILFGAQDIGTHRVIDFSAPPANVMLKKVFGAQSVFAAGDMNGDGVDDFFARESSERSFILAGHADLGETRIDVSERIASGMGSEVNGDFSSFGTTAPAGDFNNDGFDDLFFATSKTFTPAILYGNAQLDVQFVAITGFNTIGASLFSEFDRPFELAGAHDVNADGMSDLVISFNGGSCIGCTAVDKDNLDVVGGAVVIYGGEDSADGELFRPNPASNTNIKVWTEHNGSRPITAVRDFNADGIADIHLAVGTRHYFLMGGSELKDADFGHALWPYEDFSGDSSYGLMSRSSNTVFFDVNADEVQDMVVHEGMQTSVYLGKQPISSTELLVGDINEIVTLEPNSSVIYTVSGRRKMNATPITSSAIALNDDDPDLSNNIVSLDKSGVSIGVEVTDSELAGSKTTFDIRVTNDGPTHARDVLIQETLTASIENVSWTRSTQPFPEFVSLGELPIGMGAKIEAPEILRIDEFCGCPSETLNQFSGEPIYQTLGRRVGSLGDINGDGFDDVYVQATQGVGFDSKIVTLRFVGASDFGYDGQFPMPSIQFGQLAAAGEVTADFNGDGIQDKLVNSPLPIGEPREVHILYGDADGTVANISDIDGSNGFSIQGSAGIYVGAGGDLNGDGIDDAIVVNRDDESHAVHVDVVFGAVSTRAAQFDLHELDGTNGFRVMTRGIAEDLFDRNISVASGFDVNGDGVDDMLIGDESVGPYVSSSFAGRTGETYMIFGRSTPSSSGAGGIDEVIDVPVGAEVIYTLVGDLSNDASVHGHVELISSSSQFDLSPVDNVVDLPAAVDALLADINRDQRVDFADFLVLSSNFGKTNATASDGDLNEDGVVDFTDFLILSDEFGS